MGIYKDGKPDYKNEKIERKIPINNQFLEVKNSLLELEKDFMELKDREIEKLFYQPIIVSKDDMD